MIIVGAVRLGVAWSAIPTDFTKALVTLKRAEPKKRILTDEQIPLMLEAIDTYPDRRPARKGPRPDTTQLGQIVRVQLGAALRIGECIALRRGDVLSPARPGLPWMVHVAGTVVTHKIQEPGQPATYRQEWTKNGDARTVWVADFAAAVLAERLEAIADLPGDDQLLWFTRNLTPLSANNLRRLWRTIRSQAHVAADLDDITPHALRRTSGTKLGLAAGTEYASRYLGHRDQRSFTHHYFNPGKVLDIKHAGTTDHLIARRAIEA